MGAFHPGEPTPSLISWLLNPGWAFPVEGGERR